MYSLSSYIEVKTKQGVLVPFASSVECVSSALSVSDMGTIMAPRLQYIKAKLFNQVAARGSSIKVELGYDGRLNEVLNGYILTVDADVPMKITCENQAFMLKIKKIEPAAHKSITIKNLLEPLMPEGIGLSVPDFELVNIRVRKDASLLQLVQAIANDYSLRFYIKNNTLYCLLPASLSVAESTIVKVSITENTISDTLQYQSEEDFKIGIVAKALTKENKLLQVEIGDKDGEIRTFWNNNATSEADLKVFAEQKRAIYKDERVTGQITMWGEPFVRKADIVFVADAERQNINGKMFFVESVSYSWGDTGYRQTIKLGQRIK